jgi:hypothetical protein
VLSNITDVTRINSNPISAFGGINFVFDYLNKLKIDKLCQEQLPCIAAQSKYSRKDIFYSLNSIFLCGGDSVEDLQMHLKSHFINNPYVKMTSPDTMLRRLSQLAEETKPAEPKEVLLHINIALTKHLKILI